MAVKIRLRRVGRKKSPMYRIVVADSKSPRDGKFIEIVGQYQPRTGEQAINLDTDRVNHWLNVGAQPTDTVRSLLRKAGLLKHSQGLEATTPVLHLQVDHCLSTLKCKTRQQCACVLVRVGECLLRNPEERRLDHWRQTY